MIDIDVVVNGIMNRLDETNRALLSEDFLQLQSAIQERKDTIENQDKEIKALKNDKENLLRVNGNLYQKIGQQITGAFDNNGDLQDHDKKEKEIDLSTIINTKGDLI